MIKILIILCFMVAVFVIWQKWELTQFEVNHYVIESEKIKEEHRAVVIADLHGFSYGKHNERLLQQIEERCPEIILIAGDLIVSKYSETFPVALEFLRNLVQIAPVYYSFGNHETRLREVQRKNHKAFENYMSEVEKLGVRMLNNETISLKECEGIRITGLELPITYYEKGKIVPMAENYLKDFLSKPKEEAFDILLAHNPAYAEQYAAWGADITFCGHNHGGLVRIPGIGSLLSPQLTLFPKYDAGRFHFGDKNVIISRGLGTHTFHIRIFNRAELLDISFVLKDAKETQ